jgi:hypothetical protein
VDLAPSETDSSRDLERHLPDLLRTAGMTVVRLDVLTRPESFRGGEVSEEAQAITGPARDEHRARHFGFWEFVLAAAVESSPLTRAGLIRGALRHNSDHTIQTELSLKEFAHELEAGSFRDLPARHIVSLTSIAADRLQNGEPWHLPLLDMGAPAGELGLAACLAALSELGASGALFGSGRSYHFVGNQMLSPREMLTFLGRAQLLSPIVDARWISHQLLDGRCGLRISTDIDKHQRSHELVARV